MTVQVNNHAQLISTTVCSLLVMVPRMARTTTSSRTPGTGDGVTKATSSSSTPTLLAQECAEFRCRLPVLLPTELEIDRSFKNGKANINQPNQSTTLNFTM